MAGSKSRTRLLAGGIGSQAKGSAAKTAGRGQKGSGIPRSGVAIKGS